MTATKNIQTLATIYQIASSLCGFTAGMYAMRAIHLHVSPQSSESAGFNLGMMGTQIGCCVLFMVACRKKIHRLADANPQEPLSP